MTGVTINADYWKKEFLGKPFWGYNLSRTIEDSHPDLDGGFVPVQRGLVFSGTLSAPSHVGDIRTIDNPISRSRMRKAQKKDGFRRIEYPLRFVDLMSRG